MNKTRKDVVLPCIFTCVLCCVEVVFTWSLKLLEICLINNVIRQISNNFKDHVNTTSTQHNTHVKMQGSTTSLRVLFTFYSYHNVLQTWCKYILVTLTARLFLNTIPDAVLIQFDLVMISTKLLETCTGL